MLEPGRNYSVANTNYRYGFNGKENDNDIENDAYDFSSRILDTRLGGRWFSVDPLQKKYPNESPYLFTGGNPIYFKDADGKDRVENDIYVDKNGKVLARAIVQKTANSWDIISIRRESESSVMGGGSSLVVHYDWYNVGYNVIHVIDEKGNEISKTTGGDYAIGRVLTSTNGENMFGDGSWYAGLKISVGKMASGGNHDYEGIALYAEGGQGQETRIGKYTKDMAEVTGLLQTTETAGELGPYKVIAEKIKEYRDKMEESKKPSAEQNENSGISNSNSNSQSNTKPKLVQDTFYSNETKDVMYWPDGKVGWYTNSQGQEIDSKDPSKPDTMRIIRYKTPKDKKR